MAISVPIDSVDGSRQDLLKNGDPPSPDKQVPPFADSSSQVSKTPTTMRAAAWKKPGVNAKPPQKKLVLRN
jgi:hypothetical protein